MAAAVAAMVAVDVTVTVSLTHRLLPVRSGSTKPSFLPGPAQDITVLP